MPKTGSIIIPDNVNVWPHEIHTAKVLAAAGHTVIFVKTNPMPREKSADAYIDGTRWEFKAPFVNQIRTIEKRLREASKQSENVVFDACRVKRIPDHAILRELVTQSIHIKRIRHLKFISRKHEIIDII